MENIIFNVYLNNRVFKKFYVFIGNLTNKEINDLNKYKFSEYKEKYKDNIPFWKQTIKDGIRIKFINNFIYYDDTILNIKKKISYYINDDIFLLEQNQELWVEFIDNFKGRYGCKLEEQKTYLSLIYNINNYLPSIYSKIIIDKESNKTIDTYKDKNKKILFDIIDIYNIKNFTIHMNNVEFDKLYLKKEKIPLNDKIIYNYFYKYYPKGDLTNRSNSIENKLKRLNKKFEFEEYIFNLISQKHNILLNNFYITNFKIRSNFCSDKSFGDNIYLKQNYLDLTKIFNLLSVSEDVPFIKYKKTMEWVSPMIKLDKNIIDRNIINKDKLENWIKKGNRGLVIKKKINLKKNKNNENNENNNYISINIYNTGSIEISMSFPEGLNLNMNDINFILNDVKVLFDIINKTIISNEKKYLTSPLLKKVNDIYITSEKTKIIYINYIIPLNLNKQIDMNNLYSISNIFSTHLIKSLNTNKQYKYKYKRKSNFHNMHDIFKKIDEYKEQGNSNIDIKKSIQEVYSLSLDEINQLFYIYSKLIEGNEEIKESGIDILIPYNKKKIKISGCTNLIEINKIFELYNTIFNILFNYNKFSKNSEFKKYFNKNLGDSIFLNDDSVNIKLNNLKNLDNLNINLDLSKFDDISSLDMYMNNDYDNKNLQINNNSIDPVLRLRCETTGKDLIAETCNDLCEDIYFRNRRLQTYDTKLFRFKGSTYSRRCQKPVQPLLLKENPDENPKIKRNSYTYAIKYGSDPEHQNYYVCPRVYCPHCEIPLNYNEIKNTIVTRRRGKSDLCTTATCPVCKKDVFVESSEDYKDTEKGLYPGFIKEKNPDGLCLPCCKKKDIRNPKYADYKILKECLGENVNNNNNNIDTFKYILDSNKIPLSKNKIGSIPILLQKLFKNKYKHGHIEIGKKYLIRMGINLNQNQSFLEAILKIYQDDKNISINLKQFKKLIISKIINNEKLFRSLNNGNIYLIFHNKDSNNTPLENYINYILSDDIIIENYLIDLLSRPKVLFEDGINIFILKSGIIKCYPGCNHENLYDLNRESIFIFNYNQYYEPIYLLKYEKRNNIKLINKFNLTYSEPTLIYNLINKYCKETNIIDWNQLLEDNGKIYNIKYNIFKVKEPTKKYFFEQIDLINNKQYKIKCQFLDNYNKIIGFILNNDLFYPIKPTNIDLEYDMCNTNIKFLSYKETINNYQYLEKNTKLPSKIVGKIFDSYKNIINILVLETGRYINILDTKVSNDSIPILNIVYYSDADNYILNSLQNINNNIEVNKHNYDNELYERFKLEISKYIINNKEDKKNIKNIINSKDDDKLNKMKILIKKITKLLISDKRIINIDINNYKIDNIRTPCYVYNNKYKKDNLKDMCLKDSHCSYIDNICKLYIPKNGYNKNELLEYVINKLSYDLLYNQIIYKNFIKDEIRTIINDELYFPKDNEIYIYGIDYIEQFDSLYNKKDIKYKAETIDYLNPKQYTKEKLLYTKTNSNNEYLSLDEPTIYWKNILGKKFKIFKLNINYKLSLFNSISKIFENETNNDILTINKFKIILINYFKNINLKDAKQIYSKYFEDINLKNPKVYIYELYRQYCTSTIFKEDLNNFSSLINYIESENYNNCLIDAHFLGILLKVNVLILHYRKIPSNPSQYYFYNIDNSYEIIILYSEVIKEEIIYNPIQCNNKYIFKKDELPPNLIKIIYK